MWDEAAQVLSRYLSSGPVSLVLAYVGKGWDRSNTATNLLLSNDDQTVEASQVNTTTNFGLALGELQFSSGKSYSWKVRIDGEPPFVYVGAACCHDGGTDVKKVVSVNNDEAAQHACFYEFDGDMRSPAGEARFGPPFSKGDLLGVTVDCTDLTSNKFVTVLFTLNGVTVGNPVQWIPSGFPIRPMCSIGNSKGKVTLFC